MADHYDALGVSKDASTEDIRRAFKRKASETHPDKRGGRKEDFQTVQKAYEILRDSTRRLRYDTGQFAEFRNPIEVEAAIQAMQLMQHLISKVEAPEQINLILLAQQQVQANQLVIREEIAKLGAKVLKLERLRNRFKKKSKGINHMELVIEDQIKGLRKATVGAEEMITMGNAIMSVLQDYDFLVDVPPQFLRVTFTTSGNR